MKWMVTLLYVLTAHHSTLVLNPKREQPLSTENLTLARTLKPLVSVEPTTSKYLLKDKMQLTKILMLVSPPTA